MLADRLRRLGDAHRTLGTDSAQVDRAVADAHVRVVAPAPPRNVTLHEAMARNRAAADPLQTSDVVRITKVQLVRPLDPEEREEVSRQHILAAAFEEGFRLFPAQADGIYAIENYGRSGLFGNIGVGWGKCVAGDTEFFDPSVGRRRVDDLGPASVVSCDPDGKLSPRPAEAVASGEKECLRLALHSGQSVALSLDHPVLTNRGWQRAADITPDDLVASPRRMPQGTPLLGVPDDEVALVAFLMADGSTTTQAGFTNADDRVTGEFLRVAEALGGAVKPKSHQNSGKAIDLTCMGLQPLIHKHGIWRCSARTKRVPAAWYRLPENQVALFLNRFLACDGHVSATVKNPHLIECTLANEGLCRDLQFLLWRLDVRSRIRYKRASYVTKAGERRFFDSWRLVACGIEAEKLLAAVGPILGKEADCARLKKGCRRNTNTDIVPIGREELAGIADEMGIGRSALRRRLGATQGQFIGRASFGAWALEANYVGSLSYLATSDLSWERIKAITRVGVLPVFDLSVGDEHHNFVGNGIVLHNTILSLMAAEEAWKRGMDRIVLSPPAHVMGQLTHTDIPTARRRIPLSVPIFNVQGRPKQERLALAKSTRRGLFIVPHSLWTSPDAVDFFTALRPQKLILDECQAFSDPKSARTRRFKHLIGEFQPEVVGLSGSMSSKSVMEYHPIIVSALGYLSPLPLANTAATEWGIVIDAKATEDADRAQTGPILPLIKWAQRHFPDETSVLQEDRTGFRHAYQLRLNSTPGVVTSGDAGIGVSLGICNRPVAEADCVTSPGWARLQELSKQLEEAWLTPNGDEIEHSIHLYKWRWELSAGFYNELHWPAPETLAERGISNPQQVLDRTREQWLAAQEYARALRAFFQERHIPGIDTPMTVGREFAIHKDAKLPSQLYQLWIAQREMKFEGMISREERAIRVCPYKIDEAVRWAASLPKNEGALLWVWNREILNWLYEALETAGLDPVRCGQGDNAKILDPKNADRILVCSIPAHGTGKNLQHFAETYTLQFPRSARAAEQLIGRTHRNGQKADELLPITNLTTPFDRQCFSATLVDAVFAQQTSGVRQRLLLATYDPLPTMYPPEFLQAQGYMNQGLNEEGRKILADKFTVEAGTD